MITKLRLKNWRSHLESNFNFSNGTNALVGILGSGKTSVLDAICFALFGTTPNLQSRKLKLDDIIMKKPVVKNRAEAEIHFEINGKNYSVKRVIDKGKGTTYSEIRENGKLVEAPNSQRVSETVEKILRVNYELFSKAIYSEQNALDYFLTIPKGQRIKKIDELLMIDKFEKARANAVSLTNKIIERKIGKQTREERAISKKIIEIVAREGRKFNASLVLVSQRPIQLSTTALSQCNSHIILRVNNPYDLDHIGKSCEGVTSDVLKTIPGLKVGEALVTGGVVNYPLLIKVRDRKSEKSEKGIKLEDVLIKFNDEMKNKTKDLDAFS